MTGVWPVDTSHHTLLCVTLKNWAKTGRAVSQRPRHQPQSYNPGKNRGMRRNKTSRWGKKQPWSGDLAPANEGKGAKKCELHGFEMWPWYHGQWSEAPCPQLSSHAWHNSPSYHLQLDNFTPSALGAQDTGYICNADLWEDPVSVWTIFFLSDFFTSPHLPGAGASTTTTSGKSEAAPLSMTLTNRDLCGLARRGAGLWFQCFLSRCREFTFGVSNNISSSWELFSFWSAYGHKMWPCCHYQNTLRGGDQRHWGGN